MVRRLIDDEQGIVQLAWHSQEKDTLEAVARRIPKDIIQCVWEYHRTDPDEHERMLSALGRQGYEVTGSPWYGFPNAYSWARAARRLQREDAPLLGLFLTTWDHHWDAVAVVAEYNWSLSIPSFENEDALKRDLEAYFEGR